MVDFKLHGVAMPFLIATLLGVIFVTHAEIVHRNPKAEIFSKDGIVRGVSDAKTFFTKMRRSVIFFCLFTVNSQPHVV